MSGLNTPKKKNFLKETLLPITILVLIALVSVAMVILQRKDGQVTAIISHRGEILAEIDLSQVTASYEIEIGSPEGEYNLIQVESGQICINSATCPDQICVLQGYSSGEGRPIICLPHQVVITFEGQEETFDAVTG